MRILIKLLVTTVAMLAIAACGDGVNGTNSTSASSARATDGTSSDSSDQPAGLNSLVGVVTEPAGTNCAAGGKKILSGLDTNSDGVLEASEVGLTRYVCNGTDG